jgi:hypothetical protein
MTTIPETGIASLQMAIDASTRRASLLPRQIAIPPKRTLAHRERTHRQGIAVPPHESDATNAANNPLQHHLVADGPMFPDVNPFVSPAIRVIDVRRDDFQLHDYPDTPTVLEGLGGNVFGASSAKSLSASNSGCGRVSAPSQGVHP